VKLDRASISEDKEIISPQPRKVEKLNNESDLEMASPLKSVPQKATQLKEE